jgi:type IV pilus assembly protein PilY1
MKTTIVRHRLQRTGLALASAVLMLAAAAPARATNLDLAPLPLFLGGMVEPNVMMTFDDSGSMYWSYMPDTINVDYNKKRGLSASWNGMAYNPAITYALPVGPDGASLPAPTIKNKNWTAWNDGYLNYAKSKGWTTSSTCTINLYSAYRPTWHYGNHCDTNYTYTENGYPEYHTLGQAGGRQAYYYVRNTSLTGCTASDLTDEDCYKEELVTDANAYNFAVWYSYYRKRTYTAKAGIARAFNDLSPAMRVGIGRINKGSTTIDGASTETIERGVRPFTGADKTEFYKYLFLAPASGGTPTREAMRDVGRYFDGASDTARLFTDSRSAWDNTPGNGSDAAKALTCRSSYHILMSDGYWNSDSVSVGNVDAEEKANVPGISGVDPFKDTYSNTLADVAMYYYMNDLQAGLANEVPPNREDKAAWQHLVTYAVGLGLQGATIDPDDAFAAIRTGKAIPWPDPRPGNAEVTTVPARLDDMLHAAVNARGGFFAAQDPDEFARALSGFITNLMERSGSAASVVLNSNTLNDETRVYQAKFDSGNWAGQLLAYEIYDDNPATAEDESGTLNPFPVWDASKKLEAADSRRIVSFNGTEGVAFRWDNGDAADLTDAQKALLAAPTDPIDTDGDDIADFTLPAAALLDYIRGDITYEQQSNLAYPYGNRFRREGAPSPLGDIINSAPAYVGIPNAPYPNLWGLSAPESDPNNWYSEFRRRFTMDANGDPAPRKPVIYVGANDGMLHAFSAEDGEELFAYIPGKVLANLPLLADPDYDHVNYVDGSPTAVDTFFQSDSDWHTVLVSGLNSGGQGIFALDVTDPTQWTSEGAIAEKVLWEFTDADADCGEAAANTVGEAGDCDLGFTYSRPNVVRMHHGKWAAMFGNGYNNTVSDGSVSPAGHAVLYVVDIESGELIAKISTMTGAADDPLGQSRPNGLASVAPIDVDGDAIVDYAYAGDLFGNMWKFNFADPDPANWAVAYGNASKPTPLYVARSASGGVQPITTRPQVARNPSGGEGFLVMFGTGKYLEIGDNSALNQVTQTFYILLDEGSAFSGRNKLLQQKILAEVTEATDDGVPFEYRVISDSKVTWGSDKGCYLDLYNTENANTNNYGERQVSDPILRNGRVIFTTLVPVADDPCKSGGSGWLMELAANSCGRFDQEIFDVNGDGVFTVADVVDADDKPATALKVPPSGVKSKEGIVPMPAILARESGGKEFKYMSGSSGNIEMVRENPGAGDSGRQSWQQLMQ